MSRPCLVRLGLVSCAAVMLSACGGGEKAPAPAPAPATVAAPAPTAAPVATAPPADAVATISPEALKEADDIFTLRCTPCHGTAGKGDGVAAASLNPKPRDYTSADWQATVTDADIEKIIVGGGASVGKSPLMPPNPDLATKPEVVAALRTKIRAFANKP